MTKYQMVIVAIICDEHDESLILALHCMRSYAEMCELLFCNIFLNRSNLVMLCFVYVST